MALKLFPQFIFVLGLPLFFSSCNNGSNSPPLDKPGSFPVVRVEQRDVISYTSIPARIEGAVSSEIKPKVSGYIEGVHVKEGERVKKGQLLFTLETQSLNQEAAAARANVRAAQVEVDKLEPLVEKDIISPVQLETARARLAQAQSSSNSISESINYARIKSPIDGFVGSINYREGSLVSAQDVRPLTTISDISTVYAYFSMNEKDFLTFTQSAEGTTPEERIENLPPVKLLLANDTEYEEEGVIETISGDINAQTGTVTFRARFPNSQGILRNGSSGTILVPKIFEDALVIPTLSTFERQQKVFVYKVSPNDTIYDVAIDVAAKVEGLSVVLSGLEKDDRILAQGTGRVRPGMRIDPMPTKIDSITRLSEPVFK